MCYGTRVEFRIVTYDPRMIRMSSSIPRVAALVDLTRRPEAGGHVKCWERLAEAAVRSVPEIDLTVHFQGEMDEVIPLASHVRFQTHRPVFSTARLPFLSSAPDHTDLAPYHPRLARALADADLVHTTDAYFAFARTAERVAARRGIPLVNSIHTDTPSYTRVFMARTFEGMFGEGAFTRFLVDGLRLPERGERSMLAKLERHQARCAFALVSRREELARLGMILPAERTGHLRRGVDRAVFAPVVADRARLAREFGVPESATLALFVGRINRGKKAWTAAETVRSARAEGWNLHLLMAGEGEDREPILSVLGAEGASAPGPVPQSTLALFYASADLLLAPSEIETAGNVAREALSCGLPVFTHAASAAAAVVRDGVTGGVVDSGDPLDWLAVIRPFLDDPDRLVAASRAALDYARNELPSWDEVLREDLLPFWLAAVGKSPCSPNAF